MAQRDRELLEAWRAGDRAAGNELASRHLRSLYGFFRNKVEGACEDLIQRTLLNCVESIERFRGDSSFRTYLFTIARNELYQHYRRRGRERDRLDFTTVSVAALCASPSSVLAQREEQRLLLRALRRLPIDAQIAIELFYWENLTGGELAGVLGIPEGTVRTRLRRARLALESTMRELASSPEALASTVDNLERWARSLRELARSGDGASDP